jgi:phosphoenolpyruvate carboxylase
MLRYSKLTVADEIENALSYYRITFLRELPGLYDIEDDIADHTASARPQCRLMQMGSWIGGDRDGNPNVNADTMRTRCAPGHHHPRLLPRRSARAGRRTVDLDPDGVSRTAGAGRPVAGRLRHRADEPYRRALIGIYARLAATARALGATNILRKEGAPSRLPTRPPSWPTCAPRSPRSTPPRRVLVRRAWPPEARGRHLRLPPGLAGHAPVVRHPRARAGRAVRQVRRAADYARLPRRQAALLLSELAQPRLLYSPYISYSAETVPNWRLRARRANPPATARAIRNYIISHTETVSDLLEVLLLQKERACCAPLARRRALDLMVIPLFETIPDLQRAAGIMEP